MPRRPRCLAAAMAIESAPLAGRVVPSSASSPTTAYCSNSSRGELPAAGEHAERDRQIERRGLLWQFGRGEVDDDAIVRPDEAAVDQRPLDAVRAFLDRRFGQADEDRLGQRAGRDIDLDLDRHGVDADEREGVELGEHGPCSLPIGLRERSRRILWRVREGTASAGTVRGLVGCLR